MAFSVNKAILIGTLGRDPEVRLTSSGKTVTNLGVATEDSWKNKETGEWNKRTEWHRVTAWNQPEKLVAMLHKGSKVYIEGSIQTRKWQDQTGVDKYSTEIVLQGFDSKLIPLDGKSGNGSGSFGSKTSAKTSAKVPPSQDDDDDFVPF